VDEDRRELVRRFSVALPYIFQLGLQLQGVCALLLELGGYEVAFLTYCSSELLVGLREVQNVLLGEELSDVPECRRERRVLPFGISLPSHFYDRYIKPSPRSIAEYDRGKH